jgi:hypothetical protein
MRAWRAVRSTVPASKTMPASSFDEHFGETIPFDADTVVR